MENYGRYVKLYIYMLYIYAICICYIYAKMKKIKEDQEAIYNLTQL